MKKILFIAAMLYTTISFCQESSASTYYATSTTRGTKSQYSDKFVWSDYRQIGGEMEITFKRNIIFVADQAGSTYILGKNVLDKKGSNGDYQLGWSAVDEDRRKCIVKFVRYEGGGFMMYVIYDDVAFGYTLNDD